MSESTFPYVEPDYVSHPGWLLAEELEVRGCHSANSRDASGGHTRW